MRLELDVGNTRIKWRLWNQTRVDSGLDLNRALQAKPDWLLSVKEVWVSSVHDEHNAWIRQCFPKAQFAYSQSSYLGLNNSYQNVNNMGVDRWLAMLAAWYANPKKMNIVVDAGTAITLDIVDESGCHLGGYICPGLQMMKATLLAKTNKVLAQAPWQAGRSPGQSTQQCVDHGIQDMAACWVERYQLLYPQARLWLTGGDGKRLAALLAKPIESVPDLVLDGLQVYFSK